MKWLKYNFVSFLIIPSVRFDLNITTPLRFKTNITTVTLLPLFHIFTSPCLRLLRVDPEDHLNQEAQSDLGCHHARQDPWDLYLPKCSFTFIPTSHSLRSAVKQASGINIFLKCHSACWVRTETLTGPPFSPAGPGGPWGPLRPVSPMGPPEPAGPLSPGEPCHKRKTDLSVTSALWGG